MSTSPSPTLVSVAKVETRRRSSSERFAKSSMARRREGSIRPFYHTPVRPGTRPLYPLEERSRPEAAAAAHRDQPDLLVRALHLVQERGDEPSAGRPERVAEGHGPAVDVDPVHVGPELAPPGRDDRGEGLVDLDQVNVVHGHAVAPQEP